MGNVWLCCPSARPVDEVNARMSKWSDQGYKIALWRDFSTRGKDDADPYPVTDYLIVEQKYPGFQIASNRLIREVFATDPDCDWIVSAGDDTDPDQTKRADEIARECSEHFGGTFGCLQPVGDRWGENEPWARQNHPTQPAYIDRICGSPWIGREYARRINGGKGPFWEEYGHMFADEEMQNVSQRLGVLWQRRDLTQFHDHCKRDGVDRTPAFLVEAYSPQHWEKNKAIFTRRKADGFPGSEPIA